MKTKLNIDSDELKKIKLVAVAYAFVDKNLFPNEEAYKAEKEVEDRAQEVIEEIKKLGLEAKGYPGDQPMTEVMKLHGVEFPELLASLLSKHVKSPVRPKEI